MCVDDPTLRMLLCFVRHTYAAAAALQWRISATVLFYQSEYTLLLTQREEELSPPCEEMSFSEVNYICAL